MASEGHLPGEMSPETKALERELRALVPRGPRVELAKMMYLAGQASLSPVPPVAPLSAAPAWNSQWLWPVSTAVTGVVAAWLAVLLVLSHNQESLPTPQPRAIAHPLPIPPTTGNSPGGMPDVDQAVSLALPAPKATFDAADAHYLRARETALNEGVDALPTQQSAHRPEAISNYRSLMSQELRSSPTVRGSWNPWFGQ